MTSFCGNCGAKLQEASKFCMECGTRIVPPDAPVPSSGPSASSAPEPAFQSTCNPSAQPSALQRTARPVSDAAALASESVFVPTVQEVNNPHSHQDAKAKPGKYKFCLCGCVIAVLIMLFIFGFLAYFREVGHRSRLAREAENAQSTVVQSEKSFGANDTGDRASRSDEASESGNSGNSDVQRSLALQRDIEDNLREVKEARHDKEAPKFNTSALTREIQKGVILSVPENALGNKKLVVKPVAKPNELLLKADKQLKEHGVFAVAAWEVDAGLTENERLPGYYTLRADLGELGIDEKLYDRVRFYRLTDKGDLFEYSTVVDDGTASVRSNQNSYLIASVCPTINLIETIAENCYYNCFKDGDKFYLECSTESGTFKLFWNGDDVDKEFYDKLKKLKERCSLIITREKRKHPSWWDCVDCAGGSVLGFGHNDELTEAVQKALEQDAEYQKLKKQIKRLPPFIEKTAAQVTTAYEYLGQTVKVKMPGYTVCFYLKKDLGALGYQVPSLTRNPYIEINVLDSLKDTARSGGEQWDNLLLTVTHELFHICQEEYHCFIGANSKKFDEMAAVLLEADARDYYKSKKIITTNPESLIDSTFEYSFRYPMDKDEESDSGEYGYALAKFVKFIRSKSGKSAVTAKNLMDAREYDSKPNISDPLMKCFKIDKSELGNYFIAYCTDKDGFKAIDSDFSAKRFTEVVEVKPSQPAQVSMFFSGPFSCRVAMLRFPPKKKNDCAVIIVPQDNAEQAVLCFEPGKQHSQLQRGIFIPSPKKTMIGDVMMVFPPGKSETLKTGFTAYAVPAPNFRELEADSECIRFRVPKLSVAGEKGVTAGFLINFKSGDGPARTITVEPDKAGEKIELKLSGVFPQARPGKLKFTAAVCEYVLDKDGKRCCGPLSQEISASADIPELNANSHNYHYIYVPTKFSHKGAQISRSEEVSLRKANCEQTIKLRQKRLAEVKAMGPINQKPDSLERFSKYIASLQSSIDYQRKFRHNLNDPDFVNFILGKVLFINWSASHMEAYKSRTSGIGLEWVEIEGGSILSINLLGFGHFENTNPGTSGSSFTGVNRQGERLSAQLPLNGGKGSLSLNGKEYEIYRYDQETFDKYKKHLH